MTSREKVRLHETADVSDGARIGAGTSIWHQAKVREGPASAASKAT